MQAWIVVMISAGPKYKYAGPFLFRHTAEDYILELGADLVAVSIEPLIVPEGKYFRFD